MWLVEVKFICKGHGQVQLDLDAGFLVLGDRTISNLTLWTQDHRFTFKSIFVEELEHFLIFFFFAFYVVREKECRNFIFCNFVSKKGHVIC